MAQSIHIEEEDGDDGDDVEIDQAVRLCELTCPIYRAFFLLMISH